MATGGALENTATVKAFPTWDGRGATGEEAGGSFEDTNKTGGSSGDTIKVPVLELAEELKHPVKCVLCGRMTKHVVRGGGTFVVCAGECQ